jgi:acyl-CoA reductase-like NAD-dependent aldehyde dehydrogenase
VVPRRGRRRRHRAAAGDGTVWVNQNLSLRPDTPFAGHKQSGFGVENGMEGLLEYMVPQVVHVARA